MTPRGARQRPGEETRALLIDATRRLLTRGSPDAITIRAIGAEAGVQFSVVNRHFGTKDALIRRALEDTIADWILAMTDGPVDGLLTRALDYLVRNPIDVGTIRSAIDHQANLPSDRFPVIDAIVDAFAREGRSVERMNVVAALALIVGWATAESRWIQAAGAHERDARAAIVRQAERCLNPPTDA